MTSTRTTHARACELAAATFGVVSRGQLRQAGITRHQIRTHVVAGRFRVLGTQAVHVLAAGGGTIDRPSWPPCSTPGDSAWADGESALMLAGLRGWHPDRPHVGLARTTRALAVDGVDHHAPTVVPAVFSHPVRRAHPAAAAVRAASWARSDRAAATVLSMVAQQRLVRPEAMMDALRLLPKLKRRVLIGEVLGDVSEGSQSLGELDFAAMCRRRGLPKPDRQVLREGPDGRMYLDCSWSWAKLVVEIDGAHHHVGDSPWRDSPWRDALRQNTLTLQGDRVLRIPLLALRVAPEPFFAQIEAALASAAADLAS